jgi:hypothetical protein
MGDYVLESNPALGRLIERLGAEGKRPGPEKSSSLHDSKRFQRRGRSKIPKRTRENLTTLDTQTRAEVASLVEPTSLVEELVVEDDLEAIHEDPQAADEIVLIDFDEEPAVFADEDLEAFDEMGMLLEADQEDDGVSVQTVSGVDDAAGDWIFDAFKAWMLEVDQAVA